MQIANAFHRATDYDRYANVQQLVAAGLANRIRALDLPKQARILEIGCGTGFLGAKLIPHLSFAHYRMTDLAPGMINRARQRFEGTSNLDFAVMDGAHPSADGPFDLICSSLAMQWMPDLDAAVARQRALLAHRGRLIFATLAAGSFAEWRAAYGAIAPGTPDYPSIDELRALGLDVSVELFEQTHTNGQDFLRTLKAIGAGTPAPGYRPLPPSLFRNVIRRFEQAGAKARYVVATCSAGPL